MAPRYLLDTDICIHLRTGRARKAVQKLSGLSEGDAVLSVISYGELAFGAEKSTSPKAKDRLAELVVRLPVLGLPADAGLHYGRFRHRLEAADEIIGGNDLWIAAHAAAAKLILVTANEREFRRIDGLKVENWAR